LGSEGTGAQRVDVGFNILPAGVYNIEDLDYDEGDEKGSKASFFEPSSAWYHEIFTATSLTTSNTNRNSRHYGSIRCVRDAVIFATSKTFLSIDDNGTVNFYPNPVNPGQSFFVEISSEVLQKNAVIRIYNIAGQKIQQKDVQSSREEFSIAIVGVYLVQYESENLSKQCKVIVR